MLVTTVGRLGWTAAEFSFFVCYIRVKIFFHVSVFSRVSYVQMSCFQQQLDYLIKESCMIREPWTRPSTVLPLVFPFYILNAPFLEKRRQHALEQLRNAGVYDITTVHCGNIEDLQNTSCISEFPFNTRGTFSLATKHLLAARDIQLRNLPAGAIVEDDIELIPKFQEMFLHSLQHIPNDARIFHFASYRKEYHHAKDVLKQHRVSDTSIYMRNNQTTSYIGTAGYVLFYRFLDEILVPIKSAYDIHFSLQGGKIRAPQPTYVSSIWWGGQSRKFTGGTHVKNATI